MCIPQDDWTGIVIRLKLSLHRVGLLSTLTHGDGWVSISVTSESILSGDSFNEVLEVCSSIAPYGYTLHEYDWSSRYSAIFTYWCFGDHNEEE